MSQIMDDIVDTIRQNLERVKEKEAEVARQEEALKAEVTTVKEKSAALDEARLECDTLSLSDRYSTSVCQIRTKISCTGKRKADNVKGTREQ